MNALPPIPRAEERIAIIGGGFSGTLLAINLIRAGARHVSLIERQRAQLARGLAYSGHDPLHLLNVRAANMSAYPDDPGHFHRWLGAHGQVSEFASRATYGAYLHSELEKTVADHGDRLRLVDGEALRLDKAEVILASGKRVASDRVVLALGNLPPHTPGGLDPEALPPGSYIDNPWSEAVGRTAGPGKAFLLLGTGLTAVDVALSLSTQAGAGSVLALSRRGLLPRAHDLTLPPATPLRERPQGALSALVRQTRERAAQLGWRAAIDELRPVTQLLWQAAPPAMRARFLRHLRPFWDVHRHRLAPTVAAELARLIQAGRVQVAAGKLIDARGHGDQVLVRWRVRGSERVESRTVSTIINCTGPHGDLSRSRLPLLQTLLAEGRVHADALGLGIEVDRSLQVIGRDRRPDPLLLAVGPLARGELWEATAVPDLRVQVWRLAQRLTNAHWCGGEGL